MTARTQRHAKTEFMVAVVETGNAKYRNTRKEEIKSRTQSKCSRKMIPKRKTSPTQTPTNFCDAEINTPDNDGDPLANTAYYDGILREKRNWNQEESIWRGCVPWLLLQMLFRVDCLARPLTLICTFHYFHPPLKSHFLRRRSPPKYSYKGSPKYYWRKRHVQSQSRTDHASFVKFTPYTTLTTLYNSKFILYWKIMTKISTLDVLVYMK